MTNATGPVTQPDHDGMRLPWHSVRMLGWTLSWETRRIRTNGPLGSRARASVFGVLLAGLLTGACSTDGVAGSRRESMPSGQGADASMDAAKGAMTSMPGSAGKDAGPMNVYANDDDAAVECPDGTPVEQCKAVRDGCLANENCGNGADDDCDGNVEEGCACVPGTVQGCFAGPPGRRNVGACADGEQICRGAEEFGSWGPCEGGIPLGDETCDRRDNDCNGCADDGLCCDNMLSCPEPGDVRIPDGQPFSKYEMNGKDFFPGKAKSWSWQVEGGPCDKVLPEASYVVGGLTEQNAWFQPTLSGDYRVTVEVTTMDDETLSCTFIVHIAGPGLRVELCWDTSTSDDLDLYLHEPDSMLPWYSGPGKPEITTTDASCNWANCSGKLRSTRPRADWGYANSGLSACQDGPLGADFVTLGYCPNPRLDVDNNQQLASGVAENISVDNPNDGETFRVMVQNFSGTLIRPVLNIYCGGHREASFGVAPDIVDGFQGSSGTVAIGATWRPADITVHVNGKGETTDCKVVPLHPPGEKSGPYIAQDDPNY